MAVNRRQFLSGAGVALAQTPQLGGDWDVVVAGGGPAGIGAAIGAARAGAKTLLIENHAFLGGVGAWGLGMTINQMLPGGRSRGEVHEMIVSRLKAYGDEALMIRDHALITNVEYLKVVLMDALEAAGVKYLLHARVAGATVERNRVAGVVVASKQGMRKIRAKAVVDATGDADVAFFAGAETMKGRETDGFLSPMTLNIIVTNVDVDAARKAMAGGASKRLLDQARSKYPLLPETMSLSPFPLNNAVTINHSGTKLRGSLDATKLEDFTEAERYCRRQAIQIAAALREFGGPVFAKAQLANTGPQIGVRETRRVKGTYLLTEEDAKNGSRFDDAIAWRSGFLDIGFVRYERMKVHDVPYRSIVPAKMDGLLMAGRCISATHVGAAAGKSMGNCMATGHAAGIAAAFSAARKKAPRELKVSNIQAQLAKDGVDLKRHPNQEDLKA